MIEGFTESEEELFVKNAYGKIRYSNKQRKPSSKWFKDIGQYSSKDKIAYTDKVKPFEEYYYEDLE